MNNLSKMLDVTVEGRTVIVNGKARFDLAKDAYTQLYINPAIQSRVYIELFGHKQPNYKFGSLPEVFDADGNVLLWSNKKWYKKNQDVIPEYKSYLKSDNYILVNDLSSKQKKEVQLNLPKAYLIFATRLTREVYNRVTQLCKYGISPYLYIESESLKRYQILSPGNTKSMLDQKFACEAEPESKKAKLLSKVRQYHVDTVWEHVLYNCSGLWEMLQNSEAEHYYENNLPNIDDIQIRLDNLGINFNVRKAMAGVKWNKYLTNLFFKARAFGFDIDLYGQECTIDNYQIARDLFPNKATAFAETSLTLWDMPGRVEKAKIKYYQKQKLNQMPTGVDEVVNAIICVNYFESLDNNAEWYLDKEYYQQCQCGLPITTSEMYCGVCGTHNPAYDEFNVSVDTHEFNMCLEHYRENI